MRPFFLIIAMLVAGLTGCATDEEAQNYLMVEQNEYLDKHWPFRKSFISLHCELKNGRPHAWLEDGETRYALNGPASHDGTSFILDSAPEMDGNGDGAVTKTESEIWLNSRNIPMDLTERAMVLCGEY